MKLALMLLVLRPQSAALPYTRKHVRYTEETCRLFVVATGRERCQRRRRRRRRQCRFRPRVRVLYSYVPDWRAYSSARVSRSGAKRMHVYGLGGLLRGSQICFSRARIYSNLQRLGTLALPEKKRPPPALLSFFHKSNGRKFASASFGVFYAPVD